MKKNPDLPDASLISEGYALIFQEATSILEKASPDSHMLTYQSKDDVIYVSKCVVVDIEHPDNDWLLCHFDTSQGIQEGYVRARYVYFVGESVLNELI